MSDPTTTAPHILTPADLYDLTTAPFTFALGPGGQPLVFTVRRVEFLSLFLEGLVDAPLVAAADKLTTEIREWIGSGGELHSFFAQVDASAAHRGTLDRLRDYACQVVLAPTLVLGTPTGPDEFPVRLLNASVLYALYNFTPPQAIVRRLSGVEADTFRDAPQGAAGGARSDGPPVRPASIDLAAQR